MNNIFEILNQITKFETIQTQILGAEVTEDIIITEAALNILTKEFDEHYANKNYYDTDNPFFVRLFLISTPTKAKKYNIKFDNSINDFDRIFFINNLQFVIDRKSLFYYLGIIIDYIKNENEEGFVFLDGTDKKVCDYYLSFVN